VAPLAAEGERPSWGFLFAMGLIGGGPTFLGTVNRTPVHSNVDEHDCSLRSRQAPFSTFVIQLLGVARKVGRMELL